MWNLRKIVHQWYLNKKNAFTIQDITSDQQLMHFMHLLTVGDLPVVWVMNGAQTSAKDLGGI